MLDTTFTARAATPEDYPVFARLFRELGVHDPTPSRDEFVEGMLPRVLVLCEGHEAIAYVFWQIYGRTAHVSHLVVDPRVRGRGAGRALLEAVRASVVEVGCVRWYLNVKRENAAAIHLYERCGFQPRYEAWAMRLGWAKVSAVPRQASALAVFTPGAEDDAEIAARFGFDVERIALFRSRPGWALVALRDGEAIAAFAAFDSLPSRAHIFRVTRPELGGLLLDALRAHARAEGSEAIYFQVEDDRPLADALRAAGAEVLHEILQMKADWL